VALSRRVAGARGVMHVLEVEHVKGAHLACPARRGEMHTHE